MREGHVSEDRFLLRRVAWREIFPWLMIIRSFRLSISLPILFLATVGLSLMTLGDWVTHRLRKPDSPVTAQFDLPVTEIPHSAFPMARSEFYPYPWGRVGENVVQVYMGFVQPFARLFDRSLTMGDLLFQLAAVVGRIAVWSLIGGAITRVAVVYLGRDEQVSIYDAVRHSLRNWGWYLGAPLFPLLGIALLLLPLAVIGLLMRLDAGAVFAAAIWPVALLAGLAITILVLGLLGGWPLMWPTISAEEGSDSFEAFSRSYSYTFQRPLLYLFYAGVTILLGGLGWLLVDFFCEAVIGLTEWGVSFGAGSERLNGILTPPRDGMRAAAANILELWNDFVRLIAASFSYAYFFCAASAVYLLRRRDVDQTDFDEVFVPEEAIRYGLPPMPPPKTAVEE